MSTDDRHIRVSENLRIWIQKTQVKIIDPLRINVVTISMEDWETLKEAIRHDALES